MTNFSHSRLRVILIGSLVTISISSLFVNIYYVYKFGPPYHQSTDGSDVRTFSPIKLSRHITYGQKLSQERRQVYKATTKRASSFSKKKAFSRSRPVQERTTAASDINVKPADHDAAYADNFVLAASYLDTISWLPNYLLQLGQFAKDMSVRQLVAPWVFGYRVYGVKRFVANIDKGESSLALNRLYDMKLVNNLMAQCSGTMVTTFADFIKKGSRNVVIIYFKRNNFIESRQFHLVKEYEKSLMDEFKKAQIVDYLPVMSKIQSETIIKQLEDALNAELTGDSRKFHVTSFICIDNNKIVKMEKIREFVRRRRGNHTIVLLNWRGYASLNKKPYDLSRYWVETIRTFPEDKCRSIIMPFHFEVPKIAHQFLSHSKILGTNYLSVYMSVEILAKLKNAEYVDCCLKETNRVIGSIITKYHLNQAVIIGDYSEHASSACDSECVKRSVAMVTTMRRWGLNVTKFNADVTTAKHRHLAYNKFAEVSLLSTGRRLIMVGQDLWFFQIKANFIQHHPTDGISKLYTICTNSGTHLQEFSSKIIQCKKK